MATMKDVAKLAGVSHGTVSNVLKGRSSVSLENVQRVEQAIRTLGYRPDAAARSLKTASVQGIGVVLPNIIDSFFARLYTAIEEACIKKGYDPELFITREIVESENRILSHVQSLKLAGLVIVSCQPEKQELFASLLRGGVKIVFAERDIKGLDCNFVGFRNNKSIRYAVKTLIQDGNKYIGLIAGYEMYSSEQLCEEGYCRAMEEAGLPVEQKYIRYSNYTNESGFKAAMQLLHLDNPPQAILCTSMRIASGVMSAIRFVSSGKGPRIISLGEDGWNDAHNDNNAIDILPRSCMQMGEIITQLLFDNMSNRAFFEYRRILLDNIRVDLNKVRSVSVLKHNCTLRIAVLAGDIANAVSSLLPDIKRQYGISAKLVSFPHEELYNHIQNKDQDENWDVFTVDLLWLREFAAKGLLADLTADVDDHFMETIDIQPELFDDLARYNSRIYAIPYQYCNQLLFYRRDLFENVKYRRMFYDEYKTELKCPQTWTEFNAVARFFTRKFNPESATTWGTTLGAKFSSAAVCEILPRIWAWGADIFDRHGHVTINSPNAVKALTNYSESFRYASPNSPEFWWYEQVSEFARGDTAMMMLYSSYVAPVIDRGLSSIAGKVAFDSVPGTNPVLGGWSFAINPRSGKKSAALQFVKWACNSELAIPSTLLGNFSACRTIYNNIEIKSLYPWIGKSLEIFPTSKRRVLPKGKDTVSMKRYEEIIAYAVRSSILDGIPPGDALKTAAQELTALLNDDCL
jgi:DNA-binding LacI/PurR family transcriptional regulator/ABC-type glycerol-3-phosphate transport system substrate-binding protein